MSAHPPSQPVTTSLTGSSLRAGLGLALTPCVVALALQILPRVHVEPLLGEIITFAGATTFPILGLACAATADVSFAFAATIAAPAALTLLVLAWRQPAPSSTLLLVDCALVALAWAFGSSLGRRVQHATHLFPACVVAACADLASLWSPQGPSHVIAESERALSVLAVGFPVPGTGGTAPALGVGDLSFIALVLGVARAHHLPYLRSVGLCLLGTALAGAASARSGVAVPALVPIAAVIVLGLPMIRKLRPVDRNAARVSMLIAGTVALATIARGVLTGH